MAAQPDVAPARRAKDQFPKAAQGFSRGAFFLIYAQRGLEGFPRFLSARASRRWNQQEERENAEDRGADSKIKYSGVAHFVPKESRDKAGDELQQTNGRTEPANASGPQMLGDEIGCERLSNRAKDTLVKPVENE